MLPLRDPQGRIYVSTKPVAFSNSGVAYAADGSMVITATPTALDSWNGAWRLDPVGRVVVSGDISNLLFNAGEPGYYYSIYDPNALYARVNALTWSSQFQNPAWVQAGILSVTPQADGVGDLVVPTAVSASHNLLESVTIVGAPTVFYGRAKAGGYNYVVLAAGGSGLVYFDVLNGVIGSNALGVEAKIQPAPDAPGYFDFYLVHQSPNSVSSRIHIAAVDGSTVFTGDGVSGVYLARAQLQPYSTQLKPYQEVTDWTTEYLANAGYSKIGMWQDVAKTLPVTTIGQQIALLTDNRMGAGKTPGQELLLDPNLDDASKWTIGAGWAIAGGVATATAVASGITIQCLVGNRPSFAEGELVYWRFVVDSITQGSFRVSISGASIEATLASIPGVYEGFLPVLANAAGGIALRTVGVTSGVISSFSVKRTDGNKASQPTAASRWILQALYNKLTKTEQFDDAFWSKSNTTVAPNVAVAPNGTMTADKMITANGIGVGSSSVLATSAAKPATATPYVGTIHVHASEFSRLRIWVYDGVTQANRGEMSVDTSTGTITGAANALGTCLNASGTFDALNDGWYRIRLTVTTDVTPTVTIRVFPFDTGGVGDGVKGILIWGADLRPLDDASPGIPPYQRVNTAADYDTAGFPHYGQSDGTDDWMQTVAPVDFSTVDKMLAMVGQTKLSDASASLLLEHTVSSQTTPGSFSFIVPHNGNGADYRFQSGGSLPGQLAASASNYPAPNTNVLVGTGDISGDRVAIQIRGISRVGVTDQGTGNYANAVSYFGRRAGAGNSISARIYSILARGSAVPTDPTIISIVEQILMSQAGITTQQVGVVENEGLPFTNPDGAMIAVMDQSPGANDPFVAGVRLKSAYGVYMTTAQIPATGDEVFEWVERVKQNGGTVSPTTISAVRFFIVGAKNSNYWDKLGRINLFAGDQLAAALVPLKIGAGAPVDINNGFVAGDYVEGTGFKGATSVKWLDTGFLQSAVPVTGRHISTYEQIRSTIASRYSIGSEDAASQMRWSMGTASLTSQRYFSYAVNFVQCDISGQTAFGGHYVGNGTEISYTIYKDGVAGMTGVATDVPVPPSTSIGIFASNRGTGRIGFSDATLGAYSIGTLLTVTDIANFNTHMQAFQTALKRNVSMLNQGFNPSDKSVDIALSNSNKDANLNNAAASYCSARAVQSRTAGLLYFEVGIPADFASPLGLSTRVGVCDSAMQLAGDPIFDTLLGNRACTSFGGQIGSQAGYGGSPVGWNGLTNGAHTMGFLVNFASRVLTFYQDGVVGPAIGWGAGSASMFPFITLASGGGTTVKYTLRLTAGEFAQSIPSGALPWADGL